MNRNVLTFAIGAVLVVVFALLLFVFQVRQSETAVVTTFGRPVRNITEPGAYFKWPWPVQRVYKFDDRIQNFEDKFNETLTADQNNLITSVYVGWQISDASAFLNHFRDGSVPAAERMLESMLRSANIAVVSKHSLSDFVNADPQALKFDAIENEIEQAVQNELRTNECGIRLEFLGLKRFGLPESVTQTVFDRMKNERLVLINREQYEGERAGAGNQGRRRPAGRRHHRQRRCRRHAHPRRGRGRGRQNAAGLPAQSRAGEFPPAR